jgi:DNA-directed RNA polymerase beta subunit
MTIGMLREGLLGKAANKTGEIGDGTAFNPLTTEEIADELGEAGCYRYGKELMFHPHTGEPIEALIFFTPIYYHRLKHMAIDKIHARSRGPVQFLTQQPTEGRARDGGLRLYFFFPFF